MTKLARAGAHVRANKERYLDDLKPLVRVPSCSFEGPQTGMAGCPVAFTVRDDKARREPRDSPVISASGGW